MFKRNDRKKLVQLQEELAGLQRGFDQLQKEHSGLRRDVDKVLQLTIGVSTLLAEGEMDPDAVNELTKQAWMRSHPTAELTWNAEMDGVEFISNVRKHAGDDLGRILEIGPGYGRLLATILDDQIQFSDYLGLDISQETVDFLTAKFGQDHITYENADFFTFETKDAYDCIVSSAVFMHFYPSVEPAMRRCHELLDTGGHLCFDVPVGKARYLDIASQFYVRDYADPEELVAIASSIGFRDCVVEAEPGFAPGVNGWFVCATK